MRVSSFLFGLRGQIWSWRSKVISTKSCASDLWSWQKKVLSRYLNRFWSYMRLKSINWPQRSSLTSRVKGHFNIKLRTWSMKSTEKVLFRYLKRVWSYTRLKFTFWPQRSKLTSEVKGHNVNLLGYIIRVHIQNFVKIRPF